MIQIGNKDDLPSRLCDWGIAAAVFINILSMFLETFDELAPAYNFFELCENITVGVFCIEYALRIWTADHLYPELGEGRSRLRFLLSFDGIVDLLTILPFFFLSGFIVFRMLRVVRIFHLFRINTQYDSFNVITSVLMEKRNQIISSVFIIIILMLASSLGMYNAENAAQPGVFRNAFSGIWWSMSTLLTVGYGDIYPVTAVGKAMAIVIAFLGVGAVAIPTGIISAGFVEQYTKTAHSGDKLHDIEQIGELLADSESGFCGKSVGEVQAEFQMTIIVVLRGRLTVVALPDLLIEEGDILVISSDKVIKAAEDIRS